MHSRVFLKYLQGWRWFKFLSSLLLFKHNYSNNAFTMFKWSFLQFKLCQLPLEHL